MTVRWLRKLHSRIPKAADCGSLSLLASRDMPRHILALLASFSLSLSLVAFAHPGGVDANGCHKDSSNGSQHCHAYRANANKKPTYNAEHPPKAGDEAVFYGPFVSVTDGDTFKAKIQGVVMDFRMESIDAPEHDQPYGEKSKAELLSVIRGQPLVLVPSDTDRYGRTIVRAWVGKLDVNRELIKRGAAWFDSEYSKDNLLFDDESRARDAKRGLWALALKERVEPWIWRKERR